MSRKFCSVLAVVALSVVVVAGCSQPPPSSVPKDPVIIVGGTFVGQPIADIYYATMATRLRNDGYSVTVWAIPNAGLGDIADSAAALAAKVDSVRAQTGSAKVDLIGHSQGGLVGRHLVKYLGGDSKVDSLISLGTPHYGSAEANLATIFGFGSCLGIVACQQMSIGSSYLADLNAGPDQIGSVRYTNIVTVLDEIVVPFSSGYLNNDTANNQNVTVQSQCPLRIVGHILLATDGTVYSGILDALAHRSITLECLAL